MEKLFTNFGITIALMILVAALDLFVLSVTKIQLGAGFVLVLAYFIWWLIYKGKK
jgi:hypothetical protein